MVDTIWDEESVRSAYKRIFPVEGAGNEKIPLGKPGDDWKLMKPLDLSNTHCDCVDQDPVVCYLELSRETKGGVCKCKCHDDYDPTDYKEGG